MKNNSFPMRQLRFIFIFLLMISLAFSQGPQLVMSSQGFMLFAKHMHGTETSVNSISGYRLELRGLTDIIKWDRSYLSLLLANKTTIDGSEEAGFFSLNQIKYTISPDFRLEFNKWLLRAAYLHESMHTVSHATIGATVWMNSFQISAGTKGSTYLYIWEEFKDNHNRFLKHLDGQVRFGVFRKSDGTIWSGRDHDYDYQVGGRVRLQIGSFNKWAYFAGTDMTGWHRENGEWEATGLVRFNILRKGIENFGGIYYAYYFYDTFQSDNEQSLGSLGLQFIF